MFDVAILGSGPSGAHLARLLAVQGLGVCLIDRRPLDSPPTPSMPRKCCGGLLSSHAQEVLAQEGLALPVGVLVDPQIFAVRTVDFDNKLERHYQRYYFNMDRDRFERWLVSLVPSQVVRRLGARCIAIGMNPDGTHRLELDEDGERSVVEARMLVGADGAKSLVRRTHFALHPACREYVAIQETFPCPKSLPHYYGIFDSEVTDYYSWVIQKDETLLVGAALDPSLAPNERFRLLKRKLADRLGSPLDKPMRRDGAFIARPTRTAQLAFAAGSCALVGEASGCISPTSAEGFSYAFRTARQLANAIARKGPTEAAAARYHRTAGNLRLSILGKLLKSPGMYWRPLRGAVLRSGISAMTLPSA